MDLGVVFPVAKELESQVTSNLTSSTCYLTKFNHSASMVHCCCNVFSSTLSHCDYFHTLIVYDDRSPLVETILVRGSLCQDIEHCASPFVHDRGFLECQQNVSCWPWKTWFFSQCFHDMHWTWKGVASWLWKGSPLSLKAMFVAAWPVHSMISMFLCQNTLLPGTNQVKVKTTMVRAQKLA